MAAPSDFIPTPAPRRYPHPLESIPYFRRFAPSARRDLLYTLILCAAITLLLTLAAWVSIPLEHLFPTFVSNAVYSFGIGLGIRVASLLTNRIVARWFEDGGRRNYLIGALLAWMGGGYFGYIVAARILGSSVDDWTGITMAVLWVIALMTGIVFSQRQRMVAELALEREHRARVEAERLTVASRLQMLQAQIEPHFLFNTLANVSTLIEVEPKRARKMLDELTLLLRAALDSTRRPTQSLRKELEVIDAYLAVLKVRMGERLSYQIKIPDELLDLEIPAMLLQPIVENAVKHGIEPRVHGGKVRVEIAKIDCSLELVVLDNGVGFAPNSKDNVGLGAVRERLTMQFGSQAALRTDRTPDDWTRVAIRIPMPS